MYTCVCFLLGVEKGKGSKIMLARHSLRRVMVMNPTSSGFWAERMEDPVLNFF